MGATNWLGALSAALSSGRGQAELERLYGNSPGAVEAGRERFAALLRRHSEVFPEDREAALFSSPGRTEVGGNHTDHNGGRVLAAAVGLDVAAVAAPASGPQAVVDSEGYGRQVVELDHPEARAEERFQPAALTRGIAARLSELGYRVGGFHACLSSRVLKGSGLSSSAAYEVAIGTILNHFYNEGGVPSVELAKACRWAENLYYGKPCGLMDQTTCAVGGFVAIDFADLSRPAVRRIELDFAASGYELVIVDTGGHHAGLTADYAAIEQEMKQTARELGAELLRGGSRERLLARAPALRRSVGDRAILRALHFYEEDRRAAEEAEALGRGDLREFLRLAVESGESSWMLLQNCYPPGAVREQGVALGLAVSRSLLAGRGAWRVHGGGFAGTIQAFVPSGLLPRYLEAMGRLFGAQACHRLSIRQAGAGVLDLG
jgi:galactokinase